MGEICSKGMPSMLNMSNIGILSIDELIPIFYFLNIRERLNAMRVCKKWHRILCSKHAWSVINFQEDEQGIFTRDSARTLDFLKVYAGGSLREIYLYAVSKQIVNYLRKNCPNVTKVSHELIAVRMKSRDTDVGSILFLPPKVRRYELLGPILPLYRVELLKFLSRHVTLQYLVIEGFYIQADIADALKALAKKTHLQEIQIIDPSISLDNYRDSLDDILTPTIGTLTTLKCFRFSTYDSILLSNLVVCIGRWQHLKVLALRGVDCSDAAFESMIPGILNLESLELEGHIVNTSAIISIGNHLKKLKFLELGNGLYSDESISCLRHHPELQKLWIHQDFSHQDKLEPVWFQTIYDVLVTIPQLKDVNLEGYRLLFLFSKRRYEKIAGVKLEIQNTYEHPSYDESLNKLD